MRNPLFALVLAISLSWSAMGAPVAWKGGTNDWFVGTNWVGDAVPAAGDDVSITNGSVLLTNSTPLLGSFVIRGASLVFSNWNTTLQVASNVVLQTNSILTLSDSFTNNAISNRMVLVCRDLIVEPGGWINADGKGFKGAYSSGGQAVNGNGPGGGTGNTVGGGCGGGSYGGRGGPGNGQSDASRAPVYGSTNAPSSPGSGAGAGVYGNAWGGDGGGLVRVQASGDVTLHGTISANGLKDPEAPGWRSGGGSGGGIYVTCRRLLGSSGLLEAKGGGPTYGEGGGGGGGRVAVWASRYGFPGTLTALFGTSGYAVTLNGATGTVVRGYLPEPSINPTNQFGRGVTLGALAVAGTLTNLDIQLSNAGEGTNAMLWSLSTTNSWIGFSSATGTVATGAVITVTLTNDATALAAGVYTGQVTLTASNATMVDVAPETRAITIELNVTNALPPVMTAIASTNASGNYPVASVIDVTVTFSEPVALSGGTLDVALDVGRTVSIGVFGLTNQVSGTYTVQAGDSSRDLEAVGVSLSGGSLTNATGSAVWLAVPGSNISDARDLVIGRPSILLTTTAPDPTDLTSIPVSAIFSKDVTGFIVQDLIVSNASVTGFAGNGSNYTFTLLPAGRGTVWVQVPADAAQDSGETGNAASAPLTRFYAYNLSMSNLPPDGGTVNGTDTWANLVVTNVAAANPGYRFLQWTGRGVPPGAHWDNPLVMTMDRQRTIVAVFTTNDPPTTRTWSGRGAWFTWTNWAPNGFPNTDDAVIVSSGTNVLTDPVKVQSAVLTNATLTFTNWGSTLWAATAVTIRTNGAMLVATSWTNGIMSNDLTVVCEDLTIDPGGRIDVNGKGWGGVVNNYGQGPGAGTCYDAEAGGGGHGGRGGSYGGDQYRGPTNDSLTAPLLPGSSGASSFMYQSNPGGAGGGAVRIQASRNVVVNGSILAKGNWAPSRCAAGSGGGVYITCRRFDGNASGVINADGGIGGSGDGGVTGGASGNGGGGRVAVWRSRGAYAGSATANRIATGFGSPADHGTVFWGYLPDLSVWPTNQYGYGTDVHTLVAQGSTANLVLGFRDAGQSTNDLYWSLTTTNDWLSFGVSTGAVGTGTTVTVTITNDAVAKAVGVYTGQVAFVSSNRTMLGVQPLLTTVTITMHVVGSLPPVLTAVTSTNADGSYGAGAAINVSVTFSEPVTLSGGTLDVTLDTGRTIAIAPFASASSASGTYAVLAGESTPRLDSVGVSLNGGTLRNGSSADVWVALPATTIADLKAIEIGRPSVTLASTAPDPTWLTSIPVTATFSTNVTDFTLSDLIVSNAAPTNLTGAGAAYAFDLIPLTRGIVTVLLPANAAQDAGGAGNLSNSFSIAYAHRLTVNVLPSGAGDVDGTNLWSNYTVTLTPSPSGSYFFRQWTGTGVPTGSYVSNPLVLTMDQPRTLSAVFGTNTAPTTRTWNGTGMWFTLTNWTPADFPYAGDTVLINNGVCTISEPTFVAGLTVTNAAVAFTNWNSILTVDGALTVRTGGVVKASGRFPNAGPSNNIYIVCGTLTIDPGGSIQADAQGFRGGYSYYDNTLGMYIESDSRGHGPGGGTNNLSGGGGSAGGGYGGRGGPNSQGVPGGGTYGSSNAPVDPGSGAGVHIGGDGGHGGGAIRIECRGSLLLDGRISANGSNCSGGNQRGGGGSGGSVYITCRRFDGVGVLAATGGSGFTEGGGGGGGRVAVWRLYHVYGGTASVTNGICPSYPANKGEIGTLVWGQLRPGGTVFVVR